MSERTQITIETRRMIVVHGPVEWARMWCPVCDELAYTLTPESAATLTRTSVSRLFQLLDSGQIHSVGTPKAAVFICLNSINAYQDPDDGATGPVDFETGGEGQSYPFHADSRTADWAAAPPRPDPARTSHEFRGGVSFPLNGSAPAGSPIGGSPVGGNPVGGNPGSGSGLTQDLFDGLLCWLDVDREKAGYKYEEIRSSLIKLFECRGSGSAEDLADDTINRVARKLHDGQDIWIKEPSMYFYGVARNVLKESYRLAGRQVPIECLERLQDIPEGIRAQEAELEACLAHLERLLGKMPSESRELITRYYQGRGTAKIQSRMLLAESLGIPVTALRTRAHRIREKLKRALKQELRKMDLQ